MRVLSVNCIPDASERAFYAGLVALGDSVEIVVSPKDPNIEFYKTKGLNVTPLDIKSRLDFNAAKQIREILISKKIEVVYAPDNKSLGTTIFASRGLNVGFVSYRGTQGNLSLWNPAVLLTHRNPKVGGIICNCNAVRKYVDSVGVAERKLHTILKGHEIGWYQPKNKYTKSDFGFKDTDFVVGLVANIRPLKGVDILFKALAILIQKYPIQGILVGDYDKAYIDSLFKLYPVEQHVKLLGFRKDAADIIAICDLTTAPSLRREGVPRSIVESMSNKIPVIGTTIGGIPEIIEDQKTGLIVPPGDASALASGIERFFKDPELRHQFGAASQERIKTLLNLDNYVNKMRAVLQKNLNS